MAITWDVRPVFDSPIVRIVDIRWHGNEPEPTPECVSELPEITFQRTGMFVKNYGRHGVPCDPNTLLLINQGEAYCLSHPVALQCACTALHVVPRVLAEIVGQFRGAIPDRADKVFEFQQCPSRAEFAIAHHELLSAAASAGRTNPLAVEELGLRLATQVVGRAYHLLGTRRRDHRAGTARAHAETVQAVREFLAARFRERVTLTQIARHAHCAPTHLCRVFKEQTGIPIHQYLTRLRLAAGLERLAEADSSLSELAVELGFSHHSHFSTAFLAEFGVQPSRLRRWIRANGARQIRKNLKARRPLS